MATVTASIAGHPAMNASIDLLIAISSEQLLFSQQTPYLFTLRADVAVGTSIGQVMVQGSLPVNYNILGSHNVSSFLCM